MKHLNLKTAPANPGSKWKGAGKKALITAAAAATLLAAGSAVKINPANLPMGTITAYGAEQTPNWFQDGAVWKVKDGSGNTVTNAWFCDLDGSWYLLDETGAMREGLINDGGHYYSLETSHAGHYGMMRTVNGVYDGVALTFEQEHNGYYGEILSGALELIDAGADVTTVNGLPAASVYARDFGGSNTAPAQPPASNTSSYHFYDAEEIAEIEQEFLALSPEDRIALKQEMDYIMANDPGSLSQMDAELISILYQIMAKYGM